MPVTNFPIFQPSKKIKIHNEFYCVLLILLTATSFYLAYSNENLNEYFIIFIEVFFILSFIPLIVTIILNYYKIDFIKGKFKGNLVLHKNCIKIADQQILLDEIKTISFDNPDFFIRYDRNKFIGPKISCGVGNICTIKTVQNKSYQIHFYQSHDNELVKAEKMLRYYHSKKIISLNNLNKILFRTV